jgi:hypothetical protein
MLRPAVRARLEKSARYHEAMAQYHSESDAKENGKPAGQEQASPEHQTEPAEQYTESEQEPGEEVAGEATDTAQPGAEMSTENPNGANGDDGTKSTQPQMQQGSKAEVSELPRHQKMAKIHGDVAKQLRDLLQEDEGTFGVIQARDQRPVARDPAMAASARRSAIAEQLRRPGRPGGARGLNVGAIGRA